MSEAAAALGQGQSTTVERSPGWATRRPPPPPPADEVAEVPCPESTESTLSREGCNEKTQSDSVSLSLDIDSAKWRSKM